MGTTVYYDVYLFYYSLVSHNFLYLVKRHFPFLLLLLYEIDLFDIYKSMGITPIQYEHHPCLFFYITRYRIPSMSFTIGYWLEDTESLLKEVYKKFEKRNKKITIK